MSINHQHKIQLFCVRHVSFLVLKPLHFDYISVFYKPSFLFTRMRSNICRAVFLFKWHFSVQRNIVTLFCRLIGWKTSPHYFLRVSCSHVWSLIKGTNPEADFSLIYFPWKCQQIIKCLLESKCLLYSRSVNFSLYYSFLIFYAFAQKSLTDCTMISVSYKRYFIVNNCLQSTVENHWHVSILDWNFDQCVLLKSVWYFPGKLDKKLQFLCYEYYYLYHYGHLSLSTALY